MRLGFYVEELDENEVAGPSFQLHGGNSAYSFARDIRLNLFHVYLASEALTKTVGAVMTKKRKAFFHFAAASAPEDNWRSIVERVA